MTINEDPTSVLNALVALQTAIAKSEPLVIPHNGTGDTLKITPATIAFVRSSNAEADVEVVASYMAEATLGGYERLPTWEAFKAKMDARVESARTDAVKNALNTAFVAPASGRPVLVTTEFRGVFFGYATDTSGDTIHLKRARNCIYWSADAKGFLGLAATGPTKGCKVGPEADIDLRKVTCVAEVTPDAVKAWDAAPWAK